MRRQLAEILPASASCVDLVVLTGLRLGAEQLGAEAAVDAGVPFVAVLPIPDPIGVARRCRSARTACSSTSARRGR